MTEGLPLKQMTAEEFQAELLAIRNGAQHAILRVDDEAMADARAVWHASEVALAVLHPGYIPKKETRHDVARLYRYFVEAGFSFEPKEEVGEEYPTEELRRLIDAALEFGEAECRWVDPDDSGGSTEKCRSSRRWWRACGTRLARRLARRSLVIQAPQWRTVRSIYTGHQMR